MTVEWQIYVQTDSIFCHSDGCKKAHYWTMKPLSKLEFVGGEIVIKTADSKTRSWFPSMDQGIGHLWLWSPVPTKLSEKVHNTPKTMVQCGCRYEAQVASWNFTHSCTWSSVLPGWWDTCQKERNHEDETPTGKVSNTRPTKHHKTTQMTDCYMSTRKNSPHAITRWT